MSILIRILHAVATYFTLTRAQIQVVCGVKNERLVRRKLQQSCGAGLLNKTRMEVVNPGMGAPAPVYYPSRRGCELLAAELSDERYLTVCTQTPDWQHLYHWTQISQFHIVLDQAIVLSDAGVGGWHSEWDMCDPHAREPEKRYRLYTLLREKPRLVCAPDAAFLLCVREFAKVLYLEIDRGTSGIQQIAHSKTPGYAEMAKRKLHHRHFETNVDTFSVLHVSPTPGRRDLLRKAIASRECAAIHKFVAWPDWTPEKALHAAIFYTCEGEPQPLVKRSDGGGK